MQTSKPAQPTILLIDDSVTDLRLLMNLMLSRQFRVNVAFNGQDGYHKAELLLPDLILLDVNLPRLNGFATCRLLKQNPCTRHIPVIFLTAMGDVSHRLDGLALGAVDFIGKPFNEEEVLARINIHLALAEVNRAASAAAALPAGIDATPAAPPPMPIQGKDAVLVQAAQAHLREHLATPPSTEALARVLGTHERRLSQAFQLHLGCSVYAWLREERLQQAHHLLASTQVPIATLSDVLGYSSPANFAKAFRERFACTPRQVRQGQGGAPP